MVSIIQLCVDSPCIGTASGPAVTRDNKLTQQKREDCVRTVEQVFTLLEIKLHTRQIMTKKVRVPLSQ